MRYFLSRYWSARYWRTRFWGIPGPRRITCGRIDAGLRLLAKDGAYCRMSASRIDAGPRLSAKLET